MVQAKVTENKITVFKKHNATIFLFKQNINDEYLVEFTTGKYEWFSDYDNAVIFANSNDRG